MRIVPVATLTFALLSALVASTTQLAGRAASGQAPNKVQTPYSDAAVLLDTLRADLLPAELRDPTNTEREKLWVEWASARDRDIRSRLRGGDDDTIVNFLWFGTSFTHHPRMTASHLSTLPGDGSDTLLDARLDNLVAGILSPGGNERLQFIRNSVEAAGVDLASATSATETREHLAEINTRTIRELDRYQRGDLSQSAFFVERGLSSDTSILIDFAIDSALADVASEGRLEPGRARRVAIVGTGLDFFNKENGYDFYPVQTIQPFAVIDSLRRLGLATSDLQVATFDVSPRINDHLTASRQRIEGGGTYLLHLPWNTARSWGADLEAYWRQFGARIGEDVEAPPTPPTAGAVDVRAVRVAAAVVRSIAPHDLNVVVERLELAADQRFDLIIATNILIYYGVFEQSLALSNIAAMLRPGGLLLSNDYVHPLPGLPMALVGETAVSYTGISTDERVAWYERR